MRLHARLRQPRIGTTGLAQQTAQRTQPAEEIHAGFDFQHQAIRRLDGHLGREAGGDRRQPLQEFAFARLVPRTRQDPRRGGERRAQRHAGAYSSLAGERVRIEDALMRVTGIDHHLRPRVRRGRQRQQGQLRHMRCDPPLARFEFQRRLGTGPPGRQ